MLKKPVYMDNHATTRVDSRVLDAMLPYFTEKFGNAASRNHSFGWEAEEAVDRSRNQIAALIGAKSKEIIFTSGATESDNLAIKGVVEFYKDKGNHIITCVTEHKAVLDSCRALERAGKATVTYLPVDKYGMVDPDAVRRAITDKTVLITIMWATTRSARFIRLPRLARSPRKRASSFTPTPCRRLARCRLISKRPASTSRRSPRTRFTGQRESARYMFARRGRACD